MTSLISDAIAHLTNARDAWTRNNRTRCLAELGRAARLVVLATHWAREVAS